MKNKKKVLVFIPEFPVLTQTFIRREFEKLVERGNIDLVIYSIKKGDEEISDALRPRVFFDRLSYFDIPGILAYIFMHLPEILKIFYSMVFAERTGEDPDRGFMASIKILIKSVGYSQKFSRFKPDIILAHFLSEPSTICMYASRIMHIPYAISAHARDITVDAHCVNQKILSARFITICNKNAFNHALDQASKMKNSKLANIFLSYHGIDVKLLSKTVDTAGLEKPSKPLVTYVGRLTEKKGLTYLIEASDILVKRGVDHVVYICGRGPLYEELSEKIKNLRLEETVKIIGDNMGVSNKEALSYIKISDVFVFPGIQTADGDVDGIPNVLLEAGTFRIPVVVSDAGGTTEFVVDGESGLVVDQKDPKMLADKIEAVLKDRGLSMKLGQGAYNKVLSDFDTDSSILQLEKMLLEE